MVCAETIKLNTKGFTMASKAEFDDWINSQRQELENEDRAISAQKDREYASLIELMNVALGSRVTSMDNFRGIDTKVISSNIVRLAEVITAEERESARMYAVSSLLEGRSDIELDSLVAFFLRLPHDDENISGARGYMANLINEKLDDDHVEKYLDLFENVEMKPWDITILYEGLHKIKGCDDRINLIIKDGLTQRATVWGAAAAAKRRNVHELLPQLKNACIEFSDDKEIRRHIEKAIKYLEEE